MVVRPDFAAFAEEYAAQQYAKMFENAEAEQSKNIKEEQKHEKQQAHACCFNRREIYKKR